MLDQITPILITYNEAPNIERTLGNLTWAKDIVVVDSGSSDRTVDILKSFASVRVFSRPFDSLANQWRFALTETAVTTPWILRLDADYQVTEELITELRGLDPAAPVSAYRIGFDYAIFSKNLRASLYPPKTILMRAGRFTVWDDGHTESWTIDGPIAALRSRVVHDDWKPLETWMNTQVRYMRPEFERLERERSGLRDWLRLHPPIAPLTVFFYCLFGKGLIFEGRAGLFYALQRMIAEGALSLAILDSELRLKAQKRIKDG